MRNLSELNINTGGRPVTRPPPTAKEISDFQAHFGIELPKAYLELLLHANGGHPELNIIRPIGKPDLAERGINRFFFLNSDKSSEESLWVETNHWRKQLGGRIVPFAMDAGGNPFILDLSRMPTPVYTALHDERFEMVELAPSFEALIDALEANDEQ